MVKLILDGMLGRLSRWCRILGMDTAYSTTLSDNDMLVRARAEDRILVSMDRELIERCAKNQVNCISVSSNKTEEQIAQIIKETGARMGFPENMRCPACNGELMDAKADDLRGSIPADAITASPRFWRCASCGKAYWEGSHWKNMVKFYDRVKALL